MAINPLLVVEVLNFIAKVADLQSRQPKAYVVKRKPKGRVVTIKKSSEKVRS